MPREARAMTMRVTLPLSRRDRDSAQRTSCPRARLLVQARGPGAQGAGRRVGAGALLGSDASPAAGRLVTAISARCYYVLKMENYRARWQQKQTYAGRLARTNAYISPRNRGFGRFLTGSQNS